MRYVDDLNKNLDLFLNENKNNLLLGEDIKGDYGGAFKVTKNLDQKFPNQVIGTPISEATIIGSGIGLMLKGHSVVVEIMFGDFITLCVDQIVNGISKFLAYKKINEGCLIIRAPMGGYRGYGATHSQSLEHLFLNIPNVDIYSPNIFSSPGRLLQSARLSRVSLFIEHKASYSKEINLNTKKDFELLVDKENNEYDILKINDNKVDFTIFTYGYCSELALEAIIDLFIQHELNGEIIILKKIKNFNLNIFNKINSNKIITLEEGIPDHGWGVYFTRKIFNSIESFDAKNILNLGSANSLIPSSKELENFHLPSRNSITSDILKFIF